MNYMTEYATADRLQLSWQNIAEPTDCAWSDTMQGRAAKEVTLCSNADWLQPSWQACTWAAWSWLGRWQTSWQLQLNWPSAAKADRLPSRHFEVQLSDRSWADMSKLGWHIAGGSNLYSLPSGELTYCSWADTLQLSCHIVAELTDLADKLLPSRQILTEQTECKGACRS